MSEYLHYISTGDYNSNISLLKMPDAVALFDNIDQHIHELQRHLNALPNLTSKDATYVIAMFMIISIRQMRNAFFLFLRRISYDGMLLFRVGLESAVFAYRIFKENYLAKVWALKNENWPEFRDKFWKAEFPDGMPFKNEIKSQLDLLNNYWAHPNINYFSDFTVFPQKDNHLGDKQIKVHFFHYKNDKFSLYLISFLDSCIRIIAVYREILKEKFPVLITSTEEKYQRLLISLEQLKVKYKPIS